MNGESLQMLDDLRRDVDGLAHYPFGVCTSLQQGFCSYVCRGEDIFGYPLSRYREFKVHIADPIITETIERIESCLTSIATLNESVVAIEAAFLGVAVPVDKRTLRYMERMARHRYETDYRPYFFYEAHPDGRQMYERVVAEAKRHQETIEQGTAVLKERTNELIAGRPIPPRVSPEPFDESTLPPFVQDIIFPSGSAPSFEYVDPPEPEPDWMNVRVDLGDQYAKDLIDRAHNEYTDQAIRTLRGALRFGRTGLYASRAFSMLGDLYERQGRLDKALEYYTLALSAVSMPRGFKYADRGRVNFQLGRWAEAAQDFSEALKWRLSQVTYDEIQRCMAHIKANS